MMNFMRKPWWAVMTTAALILSACQPARVPVVETPGLNPTAPPSTPLPGVTQPASPAPPAIDTPAPTATPPAREITIENANQLTPLRRLGLGTILSQPVFSPDGAWLAVPASTGVGLYARGEQAAWLPAGYVYLAAFSPDGKLLAAGNPGGRVTIWDTGRAQQVHELPALSAESYLSALEFASDGLGVLVGYGAADGVRVWHPADWSLLYELPGMGAVFAPVGKTILTWRWADEGQQELVFELRGRLEGELLHSWQGSYAVYTPDGRIAVEREGLVRLMDLVSGQAVSTFSGRQLAYSPDGRFRAVSAGRVVELYDNASGSLLFTLDGVYDSAGTLLFSPDGAILAGSMGKCETPNCVFPDTMTVLWRTADGALLTAVREDAYLPWFTFQPDSRGLITAGAMGLQTLSIEDGAVQAEIEGFSPSVSALLVSAGGRWVGTAHEAGLWWWDLNSGQVVGKFESPGGCGASIHASISPDGQFMELCGNLFRAGEGNVLLSFAQRMGVSFATSQVAFSSDGRRVAVGFTSGELFLYDLANDQVERKLDGEGGAVTSLAFSADGQTLVSVSSIPDFLVQVWRVRDGERIGLLNESFFHSVALAPDGQTLAALAALDEMDVYGMPAGPVQLWDLASGEKLADLATQSALSLAFSPDGSLLATGEADGSVRLWRTADGELLAEYAGHSDRVTGVGFTPDSLHLVSASLDGSTRVWGLP